MRLRGARSAVPREAVKCEVIGLPVRPPVRWSLRPGGEHIDVAAPVRSAGEPKLRDEDGGRRHRALADTKHDNRFKSEEQMKRCCKGYERADRNPRAALENAGEICDKPVNRLMLGSIGLPQGPCP